MAGAKRSKLMAKGSFNHGPFFQNGTRGWHYRIMVMVVVKKHSILDERRLIEYIIELRKVVPFEYWEHTRKFLDYKVLGEERWVVPGEFGDGGHVQRLISAWKWIANGREFKNKLELRYCLE